MGFADPVYDKPVLLEFIFSFYDSNECWLDMNSCTEFNVDDCLELFVCGFSFYPDRSECLLLPNTALLKF